MDETSGTVDFSEKPKYDEITESSVGSLYNMLSSMGAGTRLNMIANYCLAKALSNIQEGDKQIKEETRMEYLKEAGRDTRALNKVFDGDGDGGDRGPFPR